MPSASRLTLGGGGYKMDEEHIIYMQQLEALSRKVTHAGWRALCYAQRFGLYYYRGGYVAGKARRRWDVATITFERIKDHGLIESRGKSSYFPTRLGLDFLAHMAAKRGPYMPVNTVPHFTEKAVFQNNARLPYAEN